MSGIYFFIGTIGVVIYSKIGGLLYDTLGSIYPFYAIAIYDILFVLFIVVLKVMGKDNLMA
jgi:hypothetical protein